MRREFYSGLVLIALATCTLPLSGGSLGAEEPFDYFRNSWNVIGLKDYQCGTRVTPDNRLLLADNKMVQYPYIYERQGIRQSPGELRISPTGLSHTRRMVVRQDHGCSVGR